ncbi:MAG: hypothetical protein SOT20_02840 [Candidatus Cryptobacteroides sp.]|nr:hypothetical protein [Candidatus Cryptobacteroides sp.]
MLRKVSVGESPENSGVAAARAAKAAALATGLLLCIKNGSNFIYLKYLLLQ